MIKYAVYTLYVNNKIKYILLLEKNHYKLMNRMKVLH